MKRSTMSELIKGDYQNLIYEFRGYKVMIDRDLAALYEVETRALKQQVKRNIGRFPEDFMFILTKEEFQNWRSQIVISNSEKMGLRRPPMVFTEQGVAMLSSVLKSEKAIKVNIEIMRAFAHYRALIMENKELHKELLKLDKKVNDAFKYLMKKIDALRKEKNKPRKPIGYKRKKKD